jgi:hypothetical protein
MACCKALRQNLPGGVEDSRIENFVKMVSVWAKNQHWHLAFTKRGTGRYFHNSQFE